MKKLTQRRTGGSKRPAKPTASSPARKRTFPPLEIVDWWKPGPTENEEGEEIGAHHLDIPDIRTDLRTLGDRLVRLEALVATLEFTHQEAIAELERRLVATQQRLELVAELGEQIARLEEWLTSGAIQKDLQQLCERQLTAIDKRLAVLPVRTDRANQGAKPNE